MPGVIDVGRHRGTFFAVLEETKQSQIAVMTIGRGEDGGPEETHAGDQIIYVVEGRAEVRIAGAEHVAGAGQCLVIPAGRLHHVRNAGPTPLFFLTVYAPPAY
jgi:mannose-6-phosphate isomerase-like protein (cupin superfamily)